MTRIRKLLASACVTLLVVALAAVVARSGSKQRGRTSSPAAKVPTSGGAPAGAPFTPSAAAAGSPTESPQPPPEVAARSSASAGTAPPAATPSPSQSGYPGRSTCATSATPSSGPYAWQCTHADGTPVRWAVRTIRVWIAGLTPVQRDALRTAEGHWSRYSGIATVPATAPGDAQVSITD